MIKLRINESLDIAKKAYKIKKSTPEWKFIEQDNTQLIVKIIGETAIISFRGTQEFKDLLTDALIFKTGSYVSKFKQAVSDLKKTPKMEVSLFDGLSVHYGFYTAYLAVRHKLHNYLENNDVKNVIIVGHSLGAALACICAYDLYHTNNYRVKQVVPLASPRWAGYKMAREYNMHLGDVTERYVNNADGVTRAPKLNYWHVGTLIYCDRKGKVHYNINEGKRIFDLTVTRIRSVFKFVFKIATLKFSEAKNSIESFSDHKLESYTKSFKQ